MSSDPSGPETQRLVRQVDDLADLAGALCREIRRARLVRQVLTVLFLALLVAIILVFYRLGSRLTSEDNLNEIVSLAQRRLEDNSNKYMGEVQKVADACTPSLQKAADEQVKKDMPRYMEAVNKEIPILRVHMQDSLDTRLQKHYHDQLEHQQQILIKAEPKVNDPKVRERVMAYLEATVKGLERKYYVDPLKRTLDGLTQAWDRFPVAKAPGKGEMPTSKEWISVGWKLVGLKLATITNH